MSVIRQANILGQQRLDVPHLRALESAVAADFDLLAGQIVAGDKSVVVSGFDITTTGAVGNPATSLQLNVASGIIMHPQASEAGTIFQVASNQAVEVLNSTNANVEGSFTASQTNYVGLDLRRSADDSTADLVMFLDANTLLETPKSVPLARILKYKIVISTTDFSSTPHLLPLAKVTTDAQNTVTALEDARPMMYRLGAGGSVPDRYHTFNWPSGRSENTTGAVFAGGDKALSSLKSWQDAIMTRLWELGGGQYWYSPTADRECKVIFGQPVIAATGDNFQWTLGSQTLQWQSLSVAFGNSSVAYNTITDGSAVLADHQCLYVDLDRTSIATLTAKVADLTTLGTPTVPGSRFVIAWRHGSYIFIRDRMYEVGRTINVANTVIYGTVRLKYVAGNPSDPTVLAQDANGAYSNTATSGSAFLGTGNGVGAGFDGTGGSSNGPGVKGTGGSGGPGVFGTGNGNYDGNGTAAGVKGVGGSTTTGTGVYGQGGSGGGHGVLGKGVAGGYGGYFLLSSPTSNNIALNADASAGSDATAGKFTAAVGGRGVISMVGSPTSLGTYGVAGYFATTGSNSCVIVYGADYSSAPAMVIQGGLSTGLGRGHGLAATGGQMDDGVHATGGPANGATAAGYGLIATGGAGLAAAAASPQAAIFAQGGAAALPSIGNGNNGAAAIISNGSAGSATSASTGTGGLGGDGTDITAGDGGAATHPSGGTGGAGGYGLTSSGGHGGSSTAGTGGNGGAGGYFRGGDGGAGPTNGYAGSGLLAYGGTGRASSSGDTYGNGIVCYGGANGGAGILAVPGASGWPGVIANGSTTSNVAIKSNGYIDLGGAANPAASTGFTNTVTPSNTCKAWGKIDTTNGATPSLLKGFNISAVAYSGSDLMITMANGFTNDTFYVVIPNCNQSGKIIVKAFNQVGLTNQFKIVGYDSTTGLSSALSGSGIYVDFVVFGVQ